MLVPGLVFFLALTDGDGLASAATEGATSHVRRSNTIVDESDSSPHSWVTIAAMAYVGSLVAGGTTFLVAFDTYTLVGEVPGYCGAFSLGCSTNSLLEPVVAHAIYAGVPCAVDSFRIAREVFAAEEK